VWAQRQKPFCVSYSLACGARSGQRQRRQGCGKRIGPGAEIGGWTYERSVASRLRRRASMAGWRMMPNPSRAVSTDSCRHRRKNGLPDETLAKDRFSDEETPFD
jgi:hypothetical protein